MPDTSAGSVNRTYNENLLFDPKPKKKPKPTIGILDFSSVFMSHVISETTTSLCKQVNFN